MIKDKKGKQKALQGLMIVLGNMSKGKLKSMKSKKKEEEDEEESC
jgi:hypothetical protein